MISIEAQFSLADLENQIREDVQEWFEDLAADLMATGKSITDQAISKARAIEPKDGGGFGNITHNLRSSIGCGLFINNEIREDYFPYTVKKKGQRKGRALLAKVASGLGSEEMGLIFVAGEEYAVFVQSKGYDVCELSFEKFKKEFLINFRK